MKKYTLVPREKSDHVGLYVRENVLARWGDPTVDFDSLTELVFEEAGLPRDTKLKLFSGRWVGGTGELKRFARGGHMPLTHTIYSGVGVNGTIGLPHPSELPMETQKELMQGAQTATMGKLVHNVLRAAGVRGDEFYERKHALYAEHAGDIQFLQPSAEAW